MRRRRALGAAAALCLSLISSALLARLPGFAADALTVQGVSAWSDPLAGAVHVMGEIALSNAAAGNYQDIRAQCTLLDASGKTLTETSPIEANILKPGEKAPFDDVFMTGNGYSLPSCTASGPPTTFEPDHHFTAVITTVEMIDGYQHVEGTLTNLNSLPESSVSVILTSYDPGSPSTVIDEGVAWVPGPVAGNGGKAAFDLNANQRPWDTNPAHSATLAEAPSPAVQLSADNITFPDQVKGTPSVEQILYIRNIGTGDLTLDLPSFTGDPMADFALGPDDLCTGNTVASGSSCSLGIIFIPQAVGHRSALLTLNDNASGSPNSVVVSGNGLARPAITLSAASVEFGTQIVGSSGQTTIRLTSSGLDPVHIASMQLDNGQDFGLDPGACLAAAGLTPGTSCQIGVFFHPTVDGPLQGTITITHDGRGTPTTIALSGTGAHAVPAVGLSADHLAFGEQLVGTTSAAQSVTLTSTGIGSLIISNIVASGDFRETSDCNAPLPNGSSCTVTVTFLPTDSGPRSGTLTVTDNAVGGSQTVNLTGAGITETDFYFAEGFTGPGFQETLDLLMPNKSGTATIDYYLDGGTHLQKTVDLVAGRVNSVDVRTAVGDNREVSIKVALPFPGIAERVMHFRFGNWYGSTDIVGVNHPAKEWDFAEGSTLGFFSEFLTLQNPNANDVTATLNYLTDNPNVHPTKTVVLKANSRTTIPVFIGNTSPTMSCDPASTCGIGGTFAGVSVQVIAPMPIIAERPFYVNGFSFGSGPIHDGHVAFGATAPGMTWNFAEGTTLPGFNEYLTLENPGNATAHVSLSYIEGVGPPIVRQVTVAPLSRSTVEVFKADQGVGPGAVGVSVQVTSADQAIVAERPMYIARDFGSGVVAGATDVVGSTALGNLFGFAAASTVSGESDFLTIQNPGPVDALVTISYYNVSPTVQRSVKVAARTRATVAIAGPASSGGLGSVVALLGIVLLSDQPVLVEKPTYSANGATYGATDTLGYSPPNF